MDAIPTWQEMLEDAKDVASVVALANEHLARIDPRELALLPPQCQPYELHTPVDLNVYAMTLLRCRSSDPRVVSLIQRTMAFLFECAARLAHLTGPARNVDQRDWEQRSEAA